MPREYPRFLLSHVTEGKSTGYFVVHLLEPQLLAKIELGKEGFVPFILKSFSPTVTLAELEKNEHKVLKDLRDFVIAQIAAGRIQR